MPDMRWKKEPIRRLARHASARNPQFVRHGDLALSLLECGEPSAHELVGSSLRPDVSLEEFQDRWRHACHGKQQLESNGHGFAPAVTEVLDQVDQKLQSSEPALSLLVWPLLMEQIIPKVVAEDPEFGRLFDLDRARQTIVARLSRISASLDRPHDPVTFRLDAGRFSPNARRFINNGLLQAVGRDSPQCEIEDLWRAAFDSVLGVERKLEAMGSDGQATVRIPGS